MSCINCSCRCRCSALAAITSAILGVLAAFFQIAALITITPVFLAIAFGIAIVYLSVLLIASALAGENRKSVCVCSTLSGILYGILGTILLAVILFVFAISTGSIIYALLIGLFVFFFALMLTNSACFVRHLTDCRE